MRRRIAGFLCDKRRKSGDKDGAKIEDANGEFFAHELEISEKKESPNIYGSPPSNDNDNSVSDDILARIH